MGHFSAIAGAVALAIIAIPVIVRTTDDMLRLIPEAMRQGCAAIWSAALAHDYPVGYRVTPNGLLTGVLLAIARITSEEQHAPVHRAQ